MTRIMSEIRTEVLRERTAGRPMLNVTVDTAKKSAKTNYMHQCKVNVQLGTTFSYRDDEGKNYAKAEIIEQIRRMIYGDFEEDLTQLMVSIMREDLISADELVRKLLAIARHT